MTATAQRCLAYYDELRGRVLAGRALGSRLSAAAGSSFVSPALIAELIRRGARPDAVDGTGRTTLLMAAFPLRLDVMRLLLDAGATTSTRGRDGLSALELVQRLEEGVEASEAIELLKAHSR